MFVTHAKTVEELRAEVLSDLHRRIDSLRARSNAYSKSEKEKAKYAHTINEMEEMHRFWRELEIIGKTKSFVKPTSLSERPKP